ncbi:hypothetical protein [Pseudonocardia lacus]|uniref:hypothetical protein n=1 Tax=Pseudonocardia lacus TaxID=2835865 RepID=UPI001BDCDC5B|nr:hypothetical protein [Pseudonocardia lacus]
MLTTTAATVTTTVLLALLGPAPLQPPERCKIVLGTGQCVVVALDPGGPTGGPKQRRPEPRSDRTDPTADTPATPPPPPLYPTGPIPGALGQALLPELDGEPAPPAGPPPAVLAQQAIELLDLQGPQIRTSATESAFIGVPLWLWAEPGTTTTGPVSATATAGAARVTATGRVIAIEWQLGPPGATVICDGPGTPWTGQQGPSPDCGYTYQQRSLPDRTTGTGRWTITATSVWQVTWTGTSAGTPVSGAEDVRVSSETSLAVGEVQVLVSGS